MKEISEFIEENSDKINVFDDILAKSITDKVSVLDKRIVFRFKSDTVTENFHIQLNALHKYR